MTRTMAGGVKLTNLEKVFWPGDGLTKGDLVEYYRAVAPALLPHLRNRPLTVKRYPNGIDGETFFQKNAPKGTPEWVRNVTLPAESAKRDVDYVLCNDLRTLIREEIALARVEIREQAGRAKAAALSFGIAAAALAFGGIFLLVMPERDTSWSGSVAMGWRSPTTAWASSPTALSCARGISD